MLTCTYLGYLAWVFSHLISVGRNYQREIEFAAGLSPLYASLSTQKTAIDAIMSTSEHIRASSDSIQGISSFLEQIEPICDQLQQIETPIDSVLSHLKTAQIALQQSKSYDNASEDFKFDVLEQLTFFLTVGNLIGRAADDCKDGRSFSLASNLLQLKIALRNSGGNQDQMKKLVDHPVIHALKDKIKEGNMKLDEQINAYALIPKNKMKLLVLSQIIPKQLQENSTWLLYL